MAGSYHSQMQAATVVAYLYSTIVEHGCLTKQITEDKCLLFGASTLRINKGREQKETRECSKSGQERTLKLLLLNDNT